MQQPDSHRTAARRDLIWIVAATAGFAVLCAYLELSETVLAWTRPHERFQLDELPGILLFLALALAWYAWRRRAEAQAALVLRQGAEVKLHEALIQNRELAQANLRIQEDERRTLARELHDELGQCLNAVKIDAVCLRDGKSGHIPEVRSGVMAIMEVTDHLEFVVQDMVRRLRPPGLDELGLPAALENCVDGWRRRLPSVKFTMVVAENIGNLDEVTNMTLYRLVQEGLTNVAKHARASQVDIVMHQRTGAEGGVAEVFLSVRDNGIGVPAPVPSGGLGIAGMRERVESLSGRFDLTPTLGNGFGFTALLPIHGLATG